MSSIPYCCSRHLVVLLGQTAVITVASCSLPKDARIFSESSRVRHVTPGQFQQFPTTRSKCTWSECKKLCNWDTSTAGIMR
ncbi:hypothetical protein RRG08_001395 [Elysia crispata]|uniref:Secreted protein n=1 Tax=Elysia crispata TaxID=231223 RepID=A0AAE0ZQN9_9GAST|nr:hypothetical protein RRG08_001395 [Elysia crispata]